MAKLAQLWRPGRFKIFSCQADEAGVNETPESPHLAEPFAVSQRVFSLCSLLQTYIRTHGLPAIKTVANIAYHRIFSELSIEEQLQSGMYLRELRDRPEHRIASRIKMMRILRRLNSYPVDMISDKALFAYYAKALGVKTPPTILVFENALDSRACHGRTEEGELLTSKEQWLDFLHSNLTEKFIIKGALGDGGRDIGLFRQIEDDKRYQCKGVVYSIEDIYKEVAIKKAFGKCIIQEAVPNHPEIVRMTGSPTLQCMRILTVKTKSGGIRLYSLWFKISGSPDNDTDHFLLGSTGNLSSFIDPNTKKIATAYTFDKERYEFRKVTNHPHTGEALVGWQLPYIDEAVDLAFTMHRGLSSLQAVGWDVALTPNGPMIIEGNSLWGGSGRERPYFSNKDLDAMIDMLEDYSPLELEKAA